MSTPITCKSCGQKFMAANYCPNCGAKVESSSDPVKGCLWLTLIMVVLLGFLSFLSPYLAYRGYKSQVEEDNKALIWAIAALLIGILLFVFGKTSYSEKPDNFLFIITMIGNGVGICGAVFVLIKHFSLNGGQSNQN